MARDVSVLLFSLALSLFFFFNITITRNNTILTCVDLFYSTTHSNLAFSAAGQRCGRSVSPDPMRSKYYFCRRFILFCFLCFTNRNDDSVWFMLCRFNDDSNIVYTPCNTNIPMHRHDFFFFINHLTFKLTYVDCFGERITYVMTRSQKMVVCFSSAVHNDPINRRSDFWVAIKQIKKPIYLPSHFNHNVFPSSILFCKTIYLNYN